VKKEPTKRIDLTLDELERIESLVYADQGLTLAKDIFLFSCYTGLRFSDVEILCTKHLQESPKGYFIELDKMIKTGKPISLPLFMLFEGKGETILKKYLDKLDLVIPKESAPIFGYINNQVTNRQLKIIAHDAKINKNLTYHIARHTFGTNLAELTSDPYLILDLMGHAQMSTSMIYIHNSKERMLRKLDKVDWKKS
jgi:integrase